MAARFPYRETIFGGVISVLPFFFLLPLTAIVPAVILSAALLGYLIGVFARTNLMKI